MASYGTRYGPRARVVLSKISVYVPDGRINYGARSGPAVATSPGGPAVPTTGQLWPR